MPAPKGHPRYGGRKAGTPNRRTQSLIDKCEELGVDPFIGLLELAKDSDKGIRMSALKELCQYVYPKRRAMELDANVNMDLAKKAEEFAQLPKDQQIELMEAELKRLKGE